MFGCHFLFCQSVTCLSTGVKLLPTTPFITFLTQTCSSSKLTTRVCFHLLLPDCGTRSSFLVQAEHIRAPNHVHGLLRVPQRTVSALGCHTTKNPEKWLLTWRCFKGYSAFLSNFTCPFPTAHTPTQKTMLTFDMSLLWLWYPRWKRLGRQIDKNFQLQKQYICCHQNNNISHMLKT